jgi:1,2-diacylglycerol 3-beta-glucosyltransferase
MLSLLLATLTVAYCLLILLFAAATMASHYPSVGSYRPTVSIIVAARNEEASIIKCLQSLAQITYPPSLLDIIVVDDGSTDNTVGLVEPFLAAHTHFRLVSATPGTGKLRGKTNAIAKGIDASRGEILMFTDADCSVPKQWVQETVKYYADGGIGVVAGFTLLRGSDWFSRIQALDWLVLFSAAAATTRIGYPTTAVGTNLSVRRRAYDSTGGYSTIPFSVTEDYALFHAVVIGGEYRACFPLETETLVESEPCQNWRTLHGQKKRWFTGGRGMDPKSIVVFAIPYIVNAFLVVAAVFYPSPVVWCCFSAKILVDLIFCLPALITFRLERLLWIFPLYWLYYLCYVLFYPPLVLLNNKVVWKDRSFE